jgi:hypothetical protein
VARVAALDIGDAHGSSQLRRETNLWAALQGAIATAKRWVKRPRSLLSER